MSEPTDPELLAIWDAVAALKREGEPVPPELAVRLYRLFTDPGDRLETRAMLHTAARMGEDWTREVLRLLADDEWWSTPPRGMESWPELE